MREISLRGVVANGSFFEVFHMWKKGEGAMIANCLPRSFLVYKPLVKHLTKHESSDQITFPKSSEFFSEDELAVLNYKL